MLCESPELVQILSMGALLHGTPLSSEKPVFTGYDEPSARARKRRHSPHRRTSRPRARVIIGAERSDCGLGVGRSVAAEYASSRTPGSGRSSVQGRSSSDDLAVHEHHAPRSATSRARPTCCSTSTTTAPVSSAMRRTTGSSLDDHRGEAHAHLVDEQHPRLLHRARGPWRASAARRPTGRRRATFRRWPSAGNRSRTSSTVVACRPRAARRFSSTVRVGEQGPVVGDEHQPGRVAARRPAVLQLGAGDRDRPPWARQQAGEVVSSVVLPAPLGPRMATTVPASAARSNGRTMVTAP